tara:strand:- start:178 stop:582 length:405 start_codon:yes stop_codon:yes gene_type:complete
MKINKILGALGNLDKIAEGIKNKVFKRSEVEAIAKMRWNECKMCPLLDKLGSSCAVPSSGPCCSDCGCSLGLKMRSLRSSCPKGRWGAVMPAELENKLINQFIEEDKKTHDIKLKQAKFEQEKKLKDQKNDSNI